MLRLVSMKYYYERMLSYLKFLLHVTSFLSIGNKNLTNNLLKTIDTIREICLYISN